MARIVKSGPEFEGKDVERAATSFAVRAAKKFKEEGWTWAGGIPSAPQIEEHLLDLFHSHTTRPNPTVFGLASGRLRIEPRGEKFRFDIYCEGR